MKSLKIASILAGSLAIASIGNAASISVNFAYANDGANGQFVLGAAGITGSTVWNNYQGNTTAPAPIITSAATDALDDLNVATTADVSWTAHQTWSDGSTAGDNQSLLHGYLDDNGATGINVAVVQIPYAFYEVNVFFNHDGAAGSTAVFDIDVNGATHETTGVFTRPQNGVIDSGNSLTVSGLSGDLTLSAGNRSGGKISNISGFEIVQVPEPTAAILFGLGGLALIFRRRK